MRKVGRIIVGLLAGLWLGGWGYPGEPAAEERTVLLENDQVRVRQVILQPGVQYPEHTHERPHVGVMIRGGTVEFHEKGQIQNRELSDGAVGFREAGVTHRLFNTSPQPVHFVEVELKQ